MTIYLGDVTGTNTILGFLIFRRIGDCRHCQRGNDDNPQDTPISTSWLVVTFFQLAGGASCSVRVPKLRYRCLSTGRYIGAFSSSLSCSSTCEHAPRMGGDT